MAVITHQEMKVTSWNFESSFRTVMGCQVPNKIGQWERDRAMKLLTHTMICDLTNAAVVVATTVTMLSLR